MNITIKNREGKRLSLSVENESGTKGIVFILHGLGGFKQQSHIQAMSDAFVNNGFISVRFDACNTIGESEGRLFDATATNYYADLVDVIDWAKKEDWFSAPFFLAGHSLGGLCSGLYAQENSIEVAGLVLLSPVISGEMMTTTEEFKAHASEWQESGIREWESSSNPGVIKRLPWSHIEDTLQYSLLPKVKALQSPTIILVGSEDATTPVEHQKVLMAQASGNVDLHIIDGAPHTPKSEEDIAKIEKAINVWLQTLITKNHS